MVICAQRLFQRILDHRLKETNERFPQIRFLPGETKEILEIRLNIAVLLVKLQVVPAKISSSLHENEYNQRFRYFLKAVESIILNLSNIFSLKNFD